MATNGFSKKAMSVIMAGLMMGTTMAPIAAMAVDGTIDQTITGVDAGASFKTYEILSADWDSVKDQPNSDAYYVFDQISYTSGLSAANEAAGWHTDAIPTSRGIVKWMQDNGYGGYVSQKTATSTDPNGNTVTTITWYANETFTSALSDDGSVDNTTNRPANAGAHELFDKMSKALSEGTIKTSEPTTARQPDGTNDYVVSWDEADITPRQVGTANEDGVVELNYGYRFDMLLTLIDGTTKSYRPVITMVMHKWSDNGTPADTSDDKWVLDLSNANAVAKATAMPITSVLDVKTANMNKILTVTDTFAVPVYPDNATNTGFEFEYVLPDGMTQTNSAGSAVDTNDITTTVALVGIKPDGTRETLDGSALSSITNAVDGQKTTLNFVYDQVKGYKSIEVVHKAEVDKDAVITSGNEITSVVRFASDPYSAAGSTLDTQESSDTFYTYGVHIDTLDDGGAHASNIAGAHYELTTDSNAYAKDDEDKILVVQLGEGHYRVAKGNGGVVAADASTTTDLVSAADGTIKVDGLDVGNFSLVQTIAPEGGYMKLQDAINFTVADATPDGAVDTDPLTGAEGYVQVQVPNKKAWSLPKTGGFAPFVIAGGALAAAAGWFLNKKTKKAEE